MFDELLRDLQGEPHERKLILCLDNLDRLPPAEAQSQIAALQTFWHRVEEAREVYGDDPAAAKVGLRSRVWILLPYDRTALRRAFWSSPVLGKSSETNNPADEEGFVEKIVQVSFFVPFLPLVDWRAFLKITLDRVLGEGEEVIQIAVNVFGQLALEQPPTPRQVKRFANNFAALLWQGRQMSPQVPIAAVAYFAYLLGSRSTKEIYDLLLTPAKLDQRVCNIIDNDEPEVWLASLLFHLPAAKARELWAKQAIEKALTEGDSVRLAHLSGRTGFWEHLERVDFGIIGGNDPIALLRCIAAMADVQWLSEPPHHKALELIRDRLRNALERVNTWDILTIDHSLLSSALQYFDSPNTSRRVLSRVQISRPTHQDDDDYSWLAPTTAFLDAVARDQRYAAQIEGAFSLDMMPAHYWHAAGSYQKSRPNGPGRRLFRMLNNDQCLQEIKRCINHVLIQLDEINYGGLIVAVMAADAETDVIIAQTLFPAGNENYEMAIPALDRSLELMDILADKAGFRGGQITVSPKLVELLARVRVEPSVPYADRGRLLFWTFYALEKQGSLPPDCWEDTEPYASAWQQLCPWFNGDSVNQGSLTAFAELCAKRRNYRPLRMAATAPELTTGVTQCLRHLAGAPSEVFEWGEVIECLAFDTQPEGIAPDVLSQYRQLRDTHD